MNIFLEKYFTEHLLTVTCETIREKCPNTEFFLVRIFPHSDWIRRFTPYSVRMRENTTRKNSVFEHFSRCENFIREWIVPETTHSENFYPSFETDFLELLLALVTSTFSVIVCLKSAVYPTALRSSKPPMTWIWNFHMRCTLIEDDRWRHLLVIRLKYILQTKNYLKRTWG